MDTFNIILIKPNDIIFDYMELHNGTKDYFQSFVNTDVIEIIPVTIDNMMETIINKTGLTPEIFGDTAKCLDNNNSIYQLCHIAQIDGPQEEGTPKPQEKPFNRLASYMVMGKSAIYGPAILVKSDFQEDRTCVPSNINGLDELCDVIYQRLVHTCVKLNSDGSYEIMKFVESPAEFLSEYDTNNYRFIEVNYLNFNLILFVQMDPDNKTINKRATRLAGEHKVLGTAILVCKTTENDFLNLTAELYDKMDKTAWGTLKDRDLLEYEKDDNKKVGELDVMINNFCILENRYNMLQDVSEYKCVCTGCHRVRYLSSKEQRENWPLHKKECLFEKPDINGYVKAKYIAEQEDKFIKEQQQNQLNDEADN